MQSAFGVLVAQLAREHERPLVVLDGMLGIAQVGVRVGEVAERRQLRARAFELLDERELPLMALDGAARLAQLSVNHAEVAEGRGLARSVAVRARHPKALSEKLDAIAEITHGRVRHAEPAEAVRLGRPVLTAARGTDGGHGPADLRVRMQAQVEEESAGLVEVTAQVGRHGVLFRGRGHTPVGEFDIAPLSVEERERLTRVLAAALVEVLSVPQQSHVIDCVSQLCFVRAGHGRRGAVRGHQHHTRRGEQRRASPSNLEAFYMGVRTEAINKNAWLVKTPPCA